MREAAGGEVVALWNGMDVRGVKRLSRESSCAWPSTPAVSLPLAFLETFG